MIHPDDDNGDVLRRMESHGDDLTKPRDIDFVVVFPSEVAARQFAERLGELGYAASVNFAEVEDGFPWDVGVVQDMIPSYQAITDFEDLLESVAETFGGRNDGWGCFSQPTLN